MATPGLLAVFDLRRAVSPLSAQAEAYLRRELPDASEALNAALQWQRLMPQGQHVESARRAVEDFQAQGFVRPPEEFGPTLAEAYLRRELPDASEALYVALRGQELALPGHHVESALRAVEEFQAHGFIIAPAPETEDDLEMLDADEAAFQAAAAYLRDHMRSDRIEAALTWLEGQGGNYGEAAAWYVAEALPEKPSLVEAESALIPLRA